MRYAGWMIWLAAGTALAQEAGEAAVEEGGGFLQVVTGGGVLGVILWLMLGALSMAALALIVDSFIQVRRKKMMPDQFAGLIREALEEGAPDKAAQRCRETPGALSNILLAGLEHADKGPEAVQEMVAVRADLEGEALMQRVNYLNVVGNLAPMLGLLGTVQGMILAFATLGTSAGAAKNALLAINISQALYTTAAGLIVAVPAVGFFHFFRNRAAKVLLTMESFTLEMIKRLEHS